MPAVVCLRCGAAKDAPWVACPKCRHHPGGPEDLARHALAAKHPELYEELRAESSREAWWEGDLDRIAARGLFILEVILIGVVLALTYSAFLAFGR